MSTAAHYPHLKHAADGVAYIGETRYKVLHLAGEHYHLGWFAEEILRQHPDLRPEEVYAALTYFYDHHDVIIGQLNTFASAAAEVAPANTLTREELLRRRSAAGG